MAAHYSLRCQGCMRNFDDDGFLLGCPDDHEPALLISDYSSQQLLCDASTEGIYRYHHWLPVRRRLSGTAKSAIFQNEHLNRLLGLPQLWIAFSGYWPEHEVEFMSASFKDLEAYTVLSRLPANCSDTLVVASAGNTAAAFAYMCSQNEIPCLIVIPESGLQRLLISQPLHPCVKLAVITGGADYYDAITLANRITQFPGFRPEGGVRNIARRDGLGIPLLAAVEAIGQMPQYYFQAIGSGSGGIAIHECAKRLQADGRFGTYLPRLMLSQNEPFVPIYTSWQAQRRDFIAPSRVVAKQQISQIAAHVLSNFQPPYAIRGGVFDVLKESAGTMLTATNAEAQQAVELFGELEGIDIDPAAGVAVATLRKAVQTGLVPPDAVVLLHITGGGWQGRRQLGYHSACPDIEIAVSDLASEISYDAVRTLVRSA